jgi:septation ring formation regulator EzrA
MEEILSFVLGISVVLIILGAVLLVKTIKKVEKLESNAKDAIYWIQKNDELTNKRVDQEIDRVNKLHREGISYTDSRVDKLEQKVLGNIEPKQVLKG